MTADKFLFCLVAFAVCLASALAADEDERIVNGQLISIKQASYMVQIRERGGKLCGGTLVAPDYVVTAAHCLYKKDIRTFTIVGGATTLGEAGIQRFVSKYTIHPEYNPKTLHSDIAVIELNAPILNTQILPLCRQQLQEGNKVQVSGWGKVSDGSGLSQNLRTVILPVRSHATCAAEYGPYVKKNMFCTSGLQDIGACSGDSGGPAVYNKQLCGIVAFGYQCGKVGHTGGYTSVFPLRSFIEKFMSGN